MLHRKKKESANEGVKVIMCTVFTERWGEIKPLEAANEGCQFVKQGVEKIGEG